MSECRQNKWEVNIEHNYREQNRAADFLASYSTQHATGLLLMDEPLVPFQQILLDDMIMEVPTPLAQP